MQNKINLDTHNEVIPVSEPWHRGSGFTWMLLALAGVVFFLTGAVAKAATGFFGDGSGGAIFYDVNGSTAGEGTYRSAGNLNNFDYGDFVVSSGNLLLRGGEAKTFKNGGGDVTGVNQFYRIYKDGAAGGGYSSISLPYNGELGGGDQRWKKTDSNVNLLNGLTSSGRYVTEFYWEQLGNQGTQYLSNSGSNYKTYFDLYYEISTTGSVNQDVSGGAAVLDGSGQFVKKGIGTVTLNNANSGYTGATYIDAGTVAIAQGATAGNGTIHVGLDGTSSTATISISDSDGGTTASNQINVRAGGGTRTIHGANSSGSNTFSGAIYLDSAVTLSSAAGGTLNISGALNDGGGAGGFGATISAGKVEFSGSSSNTGLTGYTVNNGAELRLNKSSGDAIQSTLTVNSGGTATLVAANQLGSGAVVDNSGTLATGSNSDSFDTLNSSGSITGSGTLTASTYNITGGTVSANLGNGTLNASGNSTINGNTTASTMNVTGDTTLNGASSATAVAVTESGTELTLGSGANRLSSSADVRLGGGTTLSIASDQTVAMIREHTANSAGGTASIANGATLTINGANQGTKFMNSISGQGGLTMAGSGNTELSLYNAQSYTGATTVSGGKLVSSGALSSAAYSVSGGTFETVGDDKIANNATVAVSGGNFIVGGNDEVGAVTATGGRLSVGGSKTVSLSANSSIGSGAEIVGGTIAVNSGTTLTLNSNDADNTSALTIASGGTIKGSFRTSGALSVDGVLAPGNSTGISYVGATTFLGGGRYQWEIDTFGSGAVVGTNWDFLDISGALTISASSGDKFWIDIVSLLASNDLAGEASGFNLTSNYSFAIATAAGGISGFDAGAFGIDTAGFQNSMGASPAYSPGVWSVSTSGNSLMLNYAGATAIPEPSSAALTLIGLGVLALRRRRG